METLNVEAFTDLADLRAEFSKWNPMRETLLHRPATAYVRPMPTQRREQMLAALSVAADMEGIESHPNLNLECYSIPGK